jgi:nucleotide-binding universal stress UspA family protein
MRIRTVLCPIDFSGLDDGELAIALEVCRTFDAKLVLHHDMPAADPGFSRIRDWTKARQGEMAHEDLAAARLRALLDRVAGTVPSDAVVTSGPLVESVLALAERLPADLMVLGSHGWSSQDHASVTSRVIDRARCPVLTFQERSDAPPFRLRPAPGGRPLRILVPTDLTPASAVAVAYAGSLARRLALQIELLHVLQDDDSGPACDRAHRALVGLVPFDLLGEVSTHVRRGEPGREITRYVEVTQPAFVVLGEHARGVLRNLLTPDTTQAVMRRIDCPAWIVPANVAAAG